MKKINLVTSNKKLHDVMNNLQEEKEAQEVLSRVVKEMFDFKESTFNPLFVKKNLDNWITRLRAISPIDEG